MLALYEDAVGGEAVLAGGLELGGDRGRAGRAASTSASAKAMNGAWPPSSSETRLSVGAHCAAISRPTRVEPVNDTARTSGLAQSAPTSSRGARR